MKFSNPLNTGTFLRRYKRFFADVAVEDGVLTVHVPNSGSMQGCSEAGSPCLYTLSDDPKRKLKGTLQFVQAPSGSWVGVNTGLPNPLVYELWESRRFFPWQEWDRCEREVKIHETSRLDLVMWNSRQGFKGARPKTGDFDRFSFHFVEVKNVSLAEDGTALFPDAETLRGQKHLMDLMDLTKMGHTAEILFVIQRQDVRSFGPATQIDPVYADLLKKAREAGVQVTPLTARLEHASVSEIELGPEPLPLMF